MPVADSIHAKLTEALKPVSLSIEDESHKHAGHAGWKPGGETHFRVKIVSEAFEGRSRVDRYRLVHALLSDELAGPVHALALELKTASEAQK